jgi:hypothetical protein
MSEIEKREKKEISDCQKKMANQNPRIESNQPNQ